MACWSDSSALGAKEPSSCVVVFLVPSRRCRLILNHRVSLRQSEHLDDLDRVGWSSLLHWQEGTYHSIAGIFLKSPKKKERKKTVICRVTIRPTKHCGFRGEGGFHSEKNKAVKLSETFFQNQAAFPQRWLGSPLLWGATREPAWPLTATRSRLQRGPGCGRSNSKLSAAAMQSAEC